MRAPIVAVLCCLTSAAWALSDEDKARGQQVNEDWGYCLMEFATRAADRTDEAATVIVDATFGACDSYMDEVYRYYSEGRHPDIAAFYVEELHSAVVKNLTRKLLAAVLAVRTLNRE